MNSLKTYLSNVSDQIAGVLNIGQGFKFRTVSKEAIPLMCKLGCTTPHLLKIISKLLNYIQSTDKEQKIKILNEIESIAKLATDYPNRYCHKYCNRCFEPGELARMKMSKDELAYEDMIMFYDNDEILKRTTRAEFKKLIGGWINKISKRGSGEKSEESD